MIRPTRNCDSTPDSPTDRMSAYGDEGESPIPEPRLQVEVAHGLQRFLLLGGAGVFFTLGVLGAILPGLPATPFLLLTSYFLLRTSPRLNAALLRSRFFGPILHDWQTQGGVQPHVKVKAVAVVILAVGLTIALSSLIYWAKLTVTALACIGVFVIAKLPTAN